MHKLFQRYALASTVVVAAFFASCSRPYATYQRMPVERFSAETPKPATQPVVAEAVTAPVEKVEEPTLVAAAAPVVKTQDIQQLNDAIAKNSAALEDKRVQKRMARVQELLTSAAAKSNVAAAPAAPKKMNMVERMMLKRLDKKIQKHLAPESPQKPMLNSGLLAAGAVFVIVGLLLTLFATGTAATVGVVGLIVGAIILLIGLI
ncbi:hypothetical protein [Tellurirhabdus bombi]|uniref:hypothetical protein n=1 Tax=Tellurirhabdus bombi TaxID=2907205 RepID=UPI001F3EC1D8|nr:hypothetical protein [Tellurirhabdus bombi]